MKISSTGSVFASIALFAVSFCSEPAQAQEKHHRTFSPKGAQPRNLESTTARPATAPPPNLYPIQASFTEDFPTIGANSDGSNLWPCLQHYHGSDGSNADCPTLGNPSLPFPKIGVVLGKPGYGWPLKNTPGVGNGFGCDALLNGTTGPLATEYPNRGPAGSHGNLRLWNGEFRPCRTNRDLPSGCHPDQRCELRLLAGSQPGPEQRKLQPRLRLPVDLSSRPGILHHRIG